MAEEAQTPMGQGKRMSVDINLLLWKQPKRITGPQERRRQLTVSLRPHSAAPYRFVTCALMFIAVYPLLPRRP